MDVGAITEKSRISFMVVILLTTVNKDPSHLVPVPAFY